MSSLVGEASLYQPLVSDGTRTEPIQRFCQTGGLFSAIARRAMWPEMTPDPQVVLARHRGDGGEEQAVTVQGLQ